MSCFESPQFVQTCQEVSAVGVMVAEHPYNCRRGVWRAAVIGVQCRGQKSADDFPGGGLRWTTVSPAGAGFILLYLNPMGACCDDHSMWMSCHFLVILPQVYTSRAVHWLYTVCAARYSSSRHGNSGLAVVVSWAIPLGGCCGGKFLAVRVCKN